MTHRLFGVLVKAENETDAMNKADVTMTRMIEDPENYTRDFYVIFDSKDDMRFRDPNGKYYQFSGSERWRCNDPKHAHHSETAHLKTSRLDSIEGQKFFKETLEAEQKLYPGYFLCDEDRRTVDNDSCIGNKEYFIVPVDVHS